MHEQPPVPQGASLLIFRDPTGQSPAVAILTDTDPETYLRHRGGSRYLAMLQAHAKAGAFRPGELRRTEVRHDNWCDLLQNNGPCDCSPDLVSGPAQESPPKRRRAKAKGKRPRRRGGIIETEEKHERDQLG